MFSDFELSISHSNEYAIAIALKKEVITDLNQVGNRNNKHNFGVNELEGIDKLATNKTNGFSKITTLIIIIILSLITANFGSLIRWVNTVVL